MNTVVSPVWETLDPATRAELDAQFRAELAEFAMPGLTDEAVEAYLAYRRERPVRAITTYEEGHIRRMLHGLVDPSRVPDPVAQEEHVDTIERWGARRLHLTNAKTYVAIMVTLTLLAVGALMVLVMSL